MLMRIDLGLLCNMHWLANTSATSLVPMPIANAPTAPCVEVCESPQTMVMPGSESPFSGPTTWMMPLSFVPIAKWRMPNSLQLLARVSTCLRPMGSLIISC